MSKAEDLAKALYPDWEMTGVSYVDGQEESMVRIQRVAYVKGYHQAEKDSELIWEDMFTIYHLVNEVLDDYAEGKTKKEIGEEVLKRFKDFKERKQQ